MDWLDLLMSPEFVVTMLAGLAAFASVMTIAMPYMQTDNLGKRMKSVANRREELKSRLRAEAEKRGSLRQKGQSGLVRRAVEDFNLRELLEGKETRMKLAQAGLRGPGPLYTFLFFQLVMPIVAFVGALIYVFMIKPGEYSTGMSFAIAAGAGFAGFYAPSVFLKNLIQKRQQNIKLAFPDCLDLLLICVESGMGIESAFHRVTHEIGSQSLELAEELGLTTAELNYLGDRRQALENLALRIGLPQVKAVTTALTQAERYGTPLGQALRVMAQENRDERMTAAEKKAAALPAQLTVPMIVFFLPVLFIVILGPAILKVMAL